MKIYINDSKVDKSLTTRLDWYDCIRGYGVIIFLLESINRLYPGQYTSNGLPDPNSPPIGVSYLGHGFLIESGNWPDFITYADIGQAWLGCLIGFSLLLSISKNTFDKQEHFLYFIFRFCKFYLFAFIYEILNEFTIPSSLEVDDLKNPFTLIAWGSLILGIVLFFNKEKKIRFFLSIGLLSIHFFLKLFDDKGYFDTINFSIPWRLINMTACILMGSCYYDLFIISNQENGYEGWKKYGVFICITSYSLVWLISFIQPADFFSMTTALALQAIAYSLFLFIISHIIYNSSHIKVQVLENLGKNMLLFFLLTVILHNFIYLFFSRELLYSNPIYPLIILGIFPFLFFIYIGNQLDKKKVIIK